MLAPTYPKLAVGKTGKISATNSQIAVEIGLLDISGIPLLSIEHIYAPMVKGFGTSTRPMSHTVLVRDR
jgi:hypothetical protein